MVIDQIIVDNDNDEGNKKRKLDLEETKVLENQRWEHVLTSLD